MSRFIAKFMLLTIGLWATAASGQDLADFKAVLQRGDFKKIRMSFSILSLDPSDDKTYEIASTYSEQEGTLMLKRFLDICIVASDAADKRCSEEPLKVTYLSNNKEDLTPVNKLSSEYSAAFVDGATQFQVNTDDPTNRKLVTTIELIATNPDKPFSKNTQISLRLQPGRNTSGGNYRDIDGRGVTLAVAVKDNLEDLQIISSKGSLTATWTDQVLVKLADKTEGPHDGVLGFVVPEGEWTNKTIPLHTYNETSPQQELTLNNACFVEETSDSECRLNCSDQEGNTLASDEHYLKQSDLLAANIAVVEAGLQPSLTIPGLSKEFRYAFITQYQPDGLERSCRIASPSDAITYTELSGGPEPALKDPRCFIATAAYGSSLDPRLDSLRWFRDHVLKASQFGLDLIEVYYRWSPPLANFIAKHETLRLITRAILWLPVTLIDLAQHNPLLLSALALLLVLGGLFSLISLYPKRHPS